MKKIILAGTFLAGVLAVKAQSSVGDFRLDGSQIINDYKLVEYALEQHNPGHTEAYDDWYNQVVEIANRQASRDSRSKLTIPVVVHVVWKETAENIADFYITEQMRVLNEAFQRKNSDSTGLRSIFQPIAGNPNIEFNLVSIERVQTNTVFTQGWDGTYDAVKKAATGGSDAWNTSQYLNIWVAYLQPSQFGAILGYAYPPNGSPNWPSNSGASNANLDGVVVDYHVFRHFGSYLGAAVKGKTAVHEVGHYLGLRHIWGDGSCNVDDGLADTPTAASQTPQNCDKTRNTCNQGAGDMPDMVENYMDYSSDDCLVAFTKDQANIMRTVLQNYRGGLLLAASVDELEENSVSLYPNPSNGTVNYSLDNTIDGSSTVTIFNVSGVEIKKMNINNKFGSVDLSSFDNGVYIFSLNNNGRILNKRIVLNK